MINLESINNTLLRILPRSKLKRVRSFLFVLFIFIFNSAFFAGDDFKFENPHEFTRIYTLPATPVKSQGKTGTCWAFATTSFIESELIRKGKGEFDLSEMFTVRQCYPLKAEKYVRYHGESNYGQGGQAHDVFMIIDKNGVVPDNVYTGMTFKQEKHNHGEMFAVLSSMLNAVVDKRGGELTPVWMNAYQSILDTYLGEIPEEFVYEGKTYTPAGFRNYLGIDVNDYIEITSYSHHPFYEKINLEVPDNWTNDLYYNVPIDEIVEIIDNSLSNGYTVAWDGDTGKDDFYKEGYAVVPVEERDVEKDRQESMEEKTVTQQMRQQAFNDYSTTDDHLMHITGLAEDQNGTKFYYTKNSWGTDDKGIDGYWYLSEQYVRLKTIAITVHRDAVPGDIKNRLGIE
jgi:bleomycin hydrolase